MNLELLLKTLVAEKIINLIILKEVSEDAGGMV
jgi:hypothetical protein